LGSLQAPAGGPVMAAGRPSALGGAFLDFGALRQVVGRRNVLGWGGAPALGPGPGLRAGSGAMVTRRVKADVAAEVTSDWVVMPSVSSGR